MKKGVAGKYFRKKRKYYFLCLFLFLSFNLYFLFLLPEIPVIYLFYLDFLVFLVVMVFIGVDYSGFKKAEQEKERFLGVEDIIYQEISAFENKEIAEHDVRIMQAKLEAQFEENCDLQDYTAKFCHEVKIPLAAGFLINEKITDTEIRLAMRENLEKIKQQLNGMLLGCRLQGSLFDLQVKKVSLLECVKTSIKNNQFFLIHKRFSMDMNVGEKFFVYTDPSWLVYILDQLLNNAIKYKGEYAMIKIWAEQGKETEGTMLFLEDHGVGIKKSEIGRIFEKGYTGSNYHNGKYKSTGMGLYLLARIAKRLGHEIRVESEYGVYTRFCIVFSDHREYFHL